MIAQMYCIIIIIIMSMSRWENKRNRLYNIII